MDYKREAIRLHEKLKGKLEIKSRAQLKTKDNLSIYYTPGVAGPCLKIRDNPKDIYKYTIKGNTIAIITDGSAVLGLGNIGADAALPVMEGKAILFKEFANIDAFPICLKTQDTDEIVDIIKKISPVFGGINLEDISAPRCFEIERRLKEELDIPIFHDDQHGTAVIALAGLINALKVTGKRMEDSKVVFSGAGAAAIAITKLLVAPEAKHDLSKPKDVILCDTKGLIYEGRTEKMNPAKEEISKITNKDKVKGTIADALIGADIFIGVSVSNVVTTEMIRSMNKDPIVFPMANPDPEIHPDDAIKGGASIVATGRSDFPNQLNNILVFPGVLRGALDARAKDINDEMKIAAARAIASCIEPTKDKIVPTVFDDIGPIVAKAVKKAAIESGVA